MNNSVFEPEIYENCRDRCSELLLKKSNDIFADASFHLNRYVLSLLMIDRYKLDEGLVFECGGKSFFSEVYKEYFGKSTFNLNIDLRDLSAFDSCTFDSILCMEVLEHIHSPLYEHTFQSDAVYNLIRNFYRVIKNGGKVFVTTPNATTIYNLKRILCRLPPRVSFGHVMEYSIYELCFIFKVCGFEILYANAEFVWSARDDFSELFKLLGDNILEYPGDDIFLVCRKPETDNYLVNINFDLNFCLEEHIYLKKDIDEIAQLFRH